MLAARRNDGKDQNDWGGEHATLTSGRAVYEDAKRAYEEHTNHASSGSGEKFTLSFRGNATNPDPNLTPLRERANAIKKAWKGKPIPAEKEAELAELQAKIAEISAAFEPSPTDELNAIEMTISSEKMKPRVVHIKTATPGQHVKVSAFAAMVQDLLATEFHVALMRTGKHQCDVEVGCQENNSARLIAAKPFYQAFGEYDVRNVDVFDCRGKLMQMVPQEPKLPLQPLFLNRAYTYSEKIRTPHFDNNVDELVSGVKGLGLGEKEGPLRSPREMERAKSESAVLNKMKMVTGRSLPAESLLRLPGMRQALMVTAQ